MSYERTAEAPLGFVSFVSAVFMAGLAAAQQSAPDITIAAASNQQGLLEYCAHQGHLDAGPARMQAKVIASFPPPQDTSAVEDAYRKGLAGTVSAMDIDESLSDAAAARGTDTAALCVDLATAVDRAASQLPSK